MLRVATDVGGTFTDIVVCAVAADGRQTVSTAKADTDDAAGVRTRRARRAAQGRRGVARDRLFRARHHGDHQRAGRAHRRGHGIDHHRGLSRRAGDCARRPAGFFQPCLRRSRRRSCRVGCAANCPGRLSYQGIETIPLDLSPLPAILDDFRTEGVQAIAVCLLHAYANPAHEQAVIAEIAELWPEVSAVAFAPDHPRVARGPALQHHGAVRLRAAGRRGVSRPAAIGDRSRPFFSPVVGSADYKTLAPFLTNSLSERINVTFDVDLILDRLTNESFASGYDVVVYDMGF